MRLVLTGLSTLGALCYLTATADGHHNYFFFSSRNNLALILRIFFSFCRVDNHTHTEHSAVMSAPFSVLYHRRSIERGKKKIYNNIYRQQKKEMIYTSKERRASEGCKTYSRRLLYTHIFFFFLKKNVFFFIFCLCMENHS
jgi:hypothetical protein